MKNYTEISRDKGFVRSAWVRDKKFTGGPSLKSAVPKPTLNLRRRRDRSEYLCRVSFAYVVMWNFQVILNAWFEDFGATGIL